MGTDARAFSRADPRAGYGQVRSWPPSNGRNSMAAASSPQTPALKAGRAVSCPVCGKAFRTEQGRGGHLRHSKDARHLSFRTIPARRFPAASTLGRESQAGPPSARPLPNSDPKPVSPSNPQGPPTPHPQREPSQSLPRPSLPAGVTHSRAPPMSDSRAPVGADSWMALLDHLPLRSCDQRRRVALGRTVPSVEVEPSAGVEHETRDQPGGPGDGDDLPWWVKALSPRKGKS